MFTYIIDNYTSQVKTFYIKVNPSVTYILIIRHDYSYHDYYHHDYSYHDYSYHDQSQQIFVVFALTTVSPLLHVFSLLC